MNRNLLIALSTIISVLILSYTYLNRYTYTSQSTIQVKGLGTTNFESDFIVWEGTFKTQDLELQRAYTKLAEDKKVVEEFLKNQHVPDSQVVFGAISTQEEFKNIYNDEGNYVDRKFMGYILQQSLKIESGNLDHIEKVSRSITEVLNKGVAFYSNSPRYYYTSLSNLKLDLIANATKDAKARAQIIASEAGAKIGDLKAAEMGVLQITGQNSGEEYRWGGAFNTSSRLKTADITMDLTYEIEN